MKQIAQIEFQVTGFIIALLLVGFFATVFGNFAVSMQNTYNISANSTLADYATKLNQSLIPYTQELKQRGNITLQEETSLTFWDTVRAGWGAVAQTFNSITLFEDITEEAVSDIPEMNDLRRYLVAIVIVIIVIGVGITVLVKMRI